MIRTATFDDLPALVDLARLYHAEFHAWLPFDPDYVRSQFLTRTIDTVDGIVRLLCHEAGVVGFLAGVKTRPFVAPIMIATEVAWFVAPEHRGRGAELIDDFEGWAKATGCVACSLSRGHFDDERKNAALDRIYRGRGYAPFETGYLKTF